MQWMDAFRVYRIFHRFVDVVAEFLDEIFKVEILDCDQFFAFLLLQWVVRLDQEFGKV